MPVYFLVTMGEKWSQLGEVLPGGLCIHHYCFSVPEECKSVSTASRYRVNCAGAMQRNQKESFEQIKSVILCMLSFFSGCAAYRNSSVSSASGEDTEGNNDTDELPHSAC